MLIIGRRIADGAPITGGVEGTPVDLTATAHGLSVVPEFAHGRRARARNPDEVECRGSRPRWDRLDRAALRQPLEAAGDRMEGP